MAYTSEQIAEIASRPIDVGGVAMEFEAKAEHLASYAKEYSEVLSHIYALENSSVHNVLSFMKALMYKDTLPGMVKQYTEEATHLSLAAESLRKII